MLKRLFICIMVLLQISSCERYIDSDGGNSHLVVEGWIDDGGFPVVILTQSLPVNSDYVDMESLGDYIVRWAKVTVSDGAESVVLTGKYDNGYFPPYIYTTGNMRGKAGQSYTLTVEYRDFRATAVTTVPAADMNCTFNVEACDGTDDLFQITANLEDNSAERNFYQIFTRTGTAAKQYQAAYMGSIDSSVFDGRADIPVWRGRRLQDKDYTPFFMADDTVSVKIAKVDEVSFRIWNSYSKNVSFSNNAFLASQEDMESNISGGYGYWCGYGAVVAPIIIRSQANRH